MKRGLSQIVTTLIIILLVFVAVGIIWAVVSNVIDEGAEDIEAFNSLTLDLQIKQVITGSPHQLVLYRGSGRGTFDGIRVVIRNDTGTFTEDHDLTMNELETTTISLDSSGTIETLAIAPYFDTGTERKLREVMDTAEVGTSGGTLPGPNTPALTLSSISDQGLGSVMIVWTSDIDAEGSLVEYGETSSYELGSVGASTPLGLNHIVSLTGLTPGMTYYYRARSCVNLNDCGFLSGTFIPQPSCTEGQQTTGQCYCSTTNCGVGNYCCPGGSCQLASCTTPINILNYVANSYYAGTEAITWTTDVNSWGYVEYGETGYDNYVGGNNPGTTSSGISISGLTPGTTYMYRITACTEAAFTNCVTVEDNFISS